ncbi:peroxide stress protein YaaA [bacterium]|nr:peroxide stress protein YaaA [bacterium]
MLVIISPAKKLNMEPLDKFIPSQPYFSHNINELINIAKNLSVDNLQNSMGLSRNLAKLNSERFANFGNQEKKSAVLAFAGDTYQGLDASSLNSDDMNWAQNHLRILSGLYGLLRPLDLIEPYRLEMGSKLKTTSGNTLYSYWGKQLSVTMNEQIKKTNSKLVINCASQEYFNAIDTSILSCQVITPIFLELKDGKQKIISFYAKKARGAMARFMIQNRLTEIDQLKSFNTGGYAYQPDQSDDKKIVYIRNYPKK